MFSRIMDHASLIWDISFEELEGVEFGGRGGPDMREFVQHYTILEVFCRDILLNLL